MTRLKLAGMAMIAMAMHHYVGTALAHTDPAAQTKARSACAQLGLNTSEAPFTACVDNLESAAAMANAAADAQERGACAAMGFASGSDRFWQCVTGLKQTLHDGPPVGQG